MNVGPYGFDDSGNPTQAYMSDIQGCAAQNQGKYYFSKIAIIAEDANV
jgi:hypothetical protein